MRAVYGRDGELAAGERFLARALESLTVLVIGGDAGIGKSALWEALRDLATASGRRVLVARPAASEAPLTLSTLADLLEGVDPVELETLPPAQRRAIDAALLRTDDEVVDADARAGMSPMSGTPRVESRVLGTALRGLLEQLALERPLVVAVDDAQWVDAASSTVLAFALRRLGHLPIGVLAARRLGEVGGLDVTTLADPQATTRLDLGPVSVGVLHHVIAGELGHAVPRAALVRIHEASGGVPLFALEIARMLDEQGLPPVGDPLPVPRDVREIVRRRVIRLPARSLEVLLATAVDGQATVDAVAAAVGRPVGPDLNVVRRLGVASVERDRITFAHPLFAAAVLSVAGDAARRRAHAQMAVVAATAEGRARHLALAAEGRSAEVAALLEVAADEAARRGSPAAAAELLDLALDATPVGDRAARDRRTLALAGALQRSGDGARARMVLEPLAGDPQPSLVRAKARIALTTVLFETDVPGSQLDLCEGAVGDAEGHPEVQAHAHAMAAAISWDDFRRRQRHVEAAQALLATVEDPDPGVHGLVLLVRCEDDISSGRPLDPALVARGLDLEQRSALPSVSDRFSAALGTWLKYGDDFAGARLWLERTLQTAFDEGDEGSVPYALSHLPELELWTGDWPAAEAIARRHRAVAEAVGLEGQRRQAAYNLGLVLVHRGEEAAARSCIGPVLAASVADGDTWTESSMRSLLGLLELSLDRAPEAAAELRRAAELRDAAGQRSPRRFDADLVESLAAIGDLDAAAKALEAAERSARAVGRHSALANAYRARAVVAAGTKDPDGALAALDMALAEHGVAPIPFDRARTMLALGRLRRRRGERSAARAALDEAATVFETLGARLWVERTSEERGRLGIRRSSTALTDGERRVAQLAAAGLTNREVAARLFVSPKTVEANLARAYAKLGVGSRAELGALVGRQPDLLA